MLQLEMEKAGQQLSQVQQMKLMVEKINVTKLTDVAALGTVVKTNVGNYFIGISIGKVTVLKDDYFVISPGSPLGRLIVGLKGGDEFSFNGKSQKVIHLF